MQLPTPVSTRRRRLGSVGAYVGEPRWSSTTRSRPCGPLDHLSGKFLPCSCTARRCAPRSAAVLSQTARSRQLLARKRRGGSGRPLRRGFRSPSRHSPSRCARVSHRPDGRAARFRARSRSEGRRLPIALGPLTPCSPRRSAPRPAGAPRGPQSSGRVTSAPPGPWQRHPGRRARLRDGRAGPAR